MTITVINIKKKPELVEEAKRNGTYLYIGRGSKWGNPYPAYSERTRTEAIAKYEKYIRNNKALMAALPELRGKTLGCFCAPKSCHGHVLKRLLEELDGE